MLFRYRHSIDKTQWLYNLITDGNGMYFLARPRRFGKTLTVSTLESIFQGKRELFKGLFIDSTDYDWKKYPVIHIDFGDCGASVPEKLDSWLNEQVAIQADTYGVSDILMKGDTCDNNFRRLITALSSESQVVILVDEYDKVLSDHIFSPHVEALRDVLGNFYQVVKTKGDVIRFAFLTGVTKYAKMSVFSRMNNLKDISMSPAYATMLGYTKEELLEYFGGYIDRGVEESGMERDAYLAKLKATYDGYRFHPRAESVYNPVSIGLFFDEGGRDFLGYWSETGNPKLLMDIAMRVDFDVLTDMEKTMDYDQMKTYDVLSLAGNVGKLTVTDLMSLLYQCGYLTLRGGYDDGLYHFGFPNREVKSSFTSSLLNANLAKEGCDVVSERNAALSALRRGKTEEAMEAIRTVFAKVPNTIMLREEKYYQSLMFMLFCSWGAERLSAEESTNIGRIDLVLEEDRELYLVECKMGETGSEALEQIRDRKYVEKYLDRKGRKRIHLLGIGFSLKERNIDTWEEEIIPLS